VFLFVFPVLIAASVVPVLPVASALPSFRTLVILHGPETNAQDYKELAVAVQQHSEHVRLCVSVPDSVYEISNRDQIASVVRDAVRECTGRGSQSKTNVTGQNQPEMSVYIAVHAKSAESVVEVARNYSGLILMGAFMKACIDPQSPIHWPHWVPGVKLPQPILQIGVELSSTIPPSVFWANAFRDYTRLDKDIQPRRMAVLLPNALFSQFSNNPVAFKHSETGFLSIKNEPRVMTESVQDATASLITAFMDLELDKSNLFKSDTSKQATQYLRSRVESTRDMLNLFDLSISDGDDGVDEGCRTAQRVMGGLEKRKNNPYLVYDIVVGKWKETEIKQFETFAPFLTEPQYKGGADVSPKIHVSEMTVYDDKKGDYPTPLPSKLFCRLNSASRIASDLWFQPPPPAIQCGEAVERVFYQAESLLTVEQLRRYKETGKKVVIGSDIVTVRMNEWIQEGKKDGWSQAEQGNRTLTLRAVSFENEREQDCVLPSVFSALEYMTFGAFQ